MTIVVEINKDTDPAYIDRQLSKIAEEALKVRIVIRVDHSEDEPYRRVRSFDSRRIHD